MAVLEMRWVALCHRLKRHLGSWEQNDEFLINLEKDNAQKRMPDRRPKFRREILGHYLHERVNGDGIDWM